jgi:hypothetical protein
MSQHGVLDLKPGGSRTTSDKPGKPPNDQVHEKGQTPPDPTDRREPTTPDPSADVRSRRAHTRSRFSTPTRFRKHGAGSRYVVSVDDRGEVTMIPAESKRN